jgi:biopolymer transport protein TolQ
MQTPIIILQSSGSLWQIITETSPFGHFILLALVTMSFISWVIIFHKWRQFREVENATDRFMRTFRMGGKLDEAIGQAKSSQVSPLARVYLKGLAELAAVREARTVASSSTGTAPTSRTDEDFEIVEMTLERTVTDEIGILERRTVFLATTGNSAPFMGLLGTVVGIMDSFWSIGERGSASLAVVAPGIAEALLATIVGLGAAIPAVIAFNWANSKTKRINDSANSFVLEFLARARKESL